MDTTRDIRIVFLEKVIANLTQQALSGFFSSVKKKPQVPQGLRQITNLLMTMKYAYAEDEVLADMPEHDTIRSLADSIIETLRASVQQDREKLAVLRFYRHTIQQFQESFRLPASLDSVIAVTTGTVATTSKHPKAKNLLLCHVNAFGETLMVVTNLVKTKPGARMKLAMVPPTHVMNILSEAQFVGEASASDLTAEKVRLTEEEKQEIRKSVGGYLES